MTKALEVRRWFAILIALLALLPSQTVRALTFLNTSGINKSVVFLLDTMNGDAHVATGFLLSVPKKGTDQSYVYLVTARHVVDPQWAGCLHPALARLYVRANKVKFDPQKDQVGAGYIPLELAAMDKTTWVKSDDDDADVAIFDVPRELLSDGYDIKAIGVKQFFGTPAEMEKVGVGSQTASSGLVPELIGVKRNYPVFKFGKIASIPDELGKARCEEGSQPRNFRVWWIGMNLIGGNSGSPIFFDPLVPPGSDINTGEPRAMLLGVQSISMILADLAGMTPVSYIMQALRHIVPSDADLSITPPSQ